MRIAKIVGLASLLFVMGILGLGFWESIEYKSFYRNHECAIFSMFSTNVEIC